MRFAIIFLALWLGGALPAGAAPAGGAPEVVISITQRADGDLAIVFESAAPTDRLLFSPLAEGYRAQSWTIKTPGIRLTRANGTDALMRKDGALFDRAVIIARPSILQLQKEYQPLAAFGADGALLYTGHFRPLSSATGARLDAVFNFSAAPGARVLAFNKRARSITNWVSPLDHPAFIYIGPLAPVESENVTVLIDPATSAWIVNAFYQGVAKGFATLAELFGSAPAAKPLLFLSVRPDGREGAMQYAGDALPGQFQIALTGKAWSRPSEQARSLFVRSTIHEAVHLWQAPARPAGDDVPQWIHEGGADAIAADAMVALGEWTGAEFAANEAAARADCARRLKFGSLNAAPARGEIRALYACGEVIAIAVATAESRPVADFWRAFVARAVADKGYDEALFYAVVAERTGSQRFADAIEDFARTSYADPGRAIDRLMARADALARAPAR